MKKKILVLICSIMVFAVITSCGSSNGNTNDKIEESKKAQQTEYVYVPEFFDWGIEVSDNDWINTYGMTNGYMIGLYSTPDMETYRTKQSVLALSLENQTLLQIPIELPGDNQYVNTFTITKEGSVYAVVEEHSFDEETGKEQYACKLVNLAQDGSLSEIADLTYLKEEIEEKSGYFYINSIAADTDGAIYVSCERDVIVFEKTGEEAFRVAASTWINNMGNMPDGSVYISYYGEGTYEIAVIDKGKKGLGTVYEASSSMNGYFTVAEGNILYYSDGMGVRRLNLETGDNIEVFKWLDSDLNGQYVETVVNLDEESFVAYYRNWNSNEENFVKLTKTDRSQLAEKEVITLATLYANSSDLQEQIVNYNRKNDTYRIELLTYLDTANMTADQKSNYEQYHKDAVTRMLNDLTGNNPPDIIALSESDISLETLARKGALEELAPYLEKAGIAESDFMEGVVESFKIDDKLFSLPTCFSVGTQLADSAIVGKEPGWTLEEALAVMQKLPEGMEFQNYATQRGFVSQYLMYGFNSFVDTAKGTCNFDSPEFKAILEMAKTFPKEYQDREEWTSEPVLLTNGELLLANVNIYSLENIQEYMAYLGGKEVTFIGMPGVGGNGSLITPYGTMFGICTKGEQKEAAAGFVIDQLTAAYQENSHVWGFPSYKPSFDDYIKDQLDVKYLKDENGELILDEEGKPIAMNGSGTIGYGDWEYEYRPCSQEDADVLISLINGATETYNYDTEIFNIILEDVEIFFNDQKSVDEVASVIQNRVSLYLTENQ